MTQSETGKDRKRILRYLRTLLDKAQDELDVGVEKPRITPSQALAAARQLERVGDMEEESSSPAEPRNPEPRKTEKREGLRQITSVASKRRKKQKVRKKLMKGTTRPLPTDFVDLPITPLLE